jgi:hypothetical protein
MHWLQSSGGENKDEMLPVNNEESYAFHFKIKKIKMTLPFNSPKGKHDGTKYQNTFIFPTS